MSQISDIIDRIASNKSSALTEVTKALQGLRSTSEYNHTISTLDERAIQRAKEIDTRLQRGEHVGRLGGVPFVAKDNFLTFGGPTTAASNILQQFEAPYQATVIEKLEAEGAICVAKANMDAFGHGSSTENSDFGPVKNPRDTTRVAGGSSGGSAAVVALDIVPFALGTDTGGSTRQPASFCGIVGVKPTYGSISRYGVVAMASSTDTIGTLARSVEDAALIMDILVGKDERDSTTLPTRALTYLPKDNPLASLRIGVISEYDSDALQPEVRTAIEAQTERLRTLGHQISSVSLPSISLSLAVYYIIVPAELSSNLARYDGIKYGHSAPEANSLQEVYGLSRAQGFNDENMRRIMIGNYVLSAGYYDAYYRKAQLVRTKIINEFDQAFNDFDVLIGPVAPTTAFKLGEHTADPLQMYLTDAMSVAASVSGLPAISLPVGDDTTGLPIGLQLIGKQKDDALLLSLAAQLQENVRE